MKRLQPVIWTKGTFLSPQHLQIQDRFLENLLQFHLESLSFRPWGFASLSISQESLAAGLFGISSASGILPDGLLFDIPNSDAAPPPKQLADCFEPDQTSIDLYLAVPHYRERGLNVATSAREGGARYRAEVELFRDENTGLSEKPVQVARKNLRLLAEGEALDGYSTLRTARIRRTEAGTFQVDPRFVPALLNFNASDYLVSIARRLVEILSSRSSAIAGMRRQKNQTLADFTAADIANFWLLYTINTTFPVFRHLFETRGGHPEALFAAMLSLAGSLTTFAPTIHPRDLPSYDHEDLGVCFTELDEKLRMLLETVVPSNFVSLPLKLIQPSIYATSIDNDKYLMNTKMYLAVNAESSQADIVNRTPQLVKVCSASHIEHLVRNALPGVPLTYVAAPPSAIPMKLNYQYFSLSQSGVAWEAVQRARNLAAYVPGDLPNPNLELIILLPQAG
ncbi:MAG TPA: type VI secretion system baseplate subunit TssK [Candidatus Sulfopaludibacter sp.]|jgi:type VI secretion system protein ImpJ|nr:type VI secretion system baseplate subunit TssK [Candidatus Sulfopaludibacter sp.]